MERLAEVLDAPVAYFYAVEDDVAELLLKFHALSAEGRATTIKSIDKLL